MAIYRRVCTYLFCGRQYKLFFSQKRERTLFVNLQIFSSLVSGQITSGYLLFFMARTCDQLGHFIRHSPFQTPAETVSDDDFDSSGKDVAHQSASNLPTVGLDAREKNVAQILEQAAAWLLKNTEQLKCLKTELNFISLYNA